MTNATRPDMDGLISGGQGRRRSRNLTMLGGAAAAVVLVGGGIFGATQLGDGDDGDSKTASEPTGSATSEPTPPSDPASVPRYTDTDGEPLTPGTYRLAVSTTGSGDVIEADVTFDGPGWSASSNPTVSDGNGTAGIGVYEPVGLAAGSGCSDDAAQFQRLGDTPQSVARQLAQLADSEVLQPPTPTEAFGRDAVHLRIRVEPDCPAANYRPIETTTGYRGMSYTLADWPLIVEFWVLEVAQSVVVVDMVHNPGTPGDVVEQAADANSSLTFVINE